MRILLVEDQPKVASFIVKGLKEQAYAVDHCLNGEDANSLISIHDYDLILLDINLPDTDGITLCKHWRSNQTQTPVIILTARASIDYRIEGLDAGANDYLCKPFDFGELLARIRVQLRQQPAEVETELTASGLRLNLINREVSRDDQKIELTSKEFALLEFLLRNKGKVVTRTSIIEHVWDMHFDSDTNLVDVFIRYLRRKIDDDFEEKIIQTKRGRGYVIH